MRRLLLSIALAVWCFGAAVQAAPVMPAASTPPAPAPAASPAMPRPQKKTLPNGLTVLVLENHAAPVVAVRMYVKTGSIYEGQYLGAGISHLFEHTLGEGTKTHTKVQLDQEVEAIGGQTNAYTSQDVTCYHITTAASYFDRALATLADQMQNANFPEAEVKTQQGIIHNEMNLDDDDPDRVLSELFYATSFRVHPVRLPIIGFRAAFDRLTRDDIVNYYNTHYTPENTIVAIAGDVSAPQVFEKVEAEFKNWEHRTAATPAVPAEPLQTAPRSSFVEKDVQLAYLQMGWHTVPLQHPDLYALDMLAQILGAGESSRLVRALRDEQNLVASIAAFSATPNYDAGVFSIRATLPPENLKKVQDAAWAEVGKIWRDGVSADELKRAQRQIEAAFIFNNSSVEDQAEQMAYDEMGTGDPGYSKRYVARIRAVTPAQVQAAAVKYLTRESLTTVGVVPRGQAPKPVVAGAAVTGAPAQLVKLPNGLRLVIRENHATPTVAISAIALGGARLEPGGKEGAANLTAQMLTRGTAKRSAAQIAQTVDALGGSLDGFSGYNAWGMHSQWLAADWRKGLSLVQESLLLPTFPADELERAKTQTVAALKEQEDDPSGAASLLLRQTFFGAHPYGRSALGKAEVVKALTRDDLKAYWSSVLRPASMVLAIYGDVNAADVERVAGVLFGGLPAGSALPAAPPPAPPLAKFTQAQQPKPGAAQAVLFYGFPGIVVKDPDRYAIDVLDSALSGASLPGGRLHARLRDNQLVYVVHAFDQPGIEPGMFVVYAATTKPNVAEVRRIIDEELGKVREAPITAEELARAKTMTISAHAVENQSNAAQAEEAASNELFGLGYDQSTRYEAKINAVTLADVQRAAKKYLRPDASALALIEPQ